MKKLLAVALVATSTAVSAAADRAIYDIMYLPNAGTTYGETDYSYAKSEVKARQDSDISGWGINQVIGHAFTDRFSLQADINYVDIESDPDGGSKFTQEGFSDPTLTARFRAMDEAWRLDILGGSTISLGDSETERDGDTDNRQGGSDLFLGAQIGQRWDNMQWALLGQYTNYFDATTDDKEQGGDVDSDSHGEWLLRADLLNKLAEKSFLRTHLSGEWTEKFDAELGNASSSQAPNAYYEVGAEYQHLFSQDLLARAGVDYFQFHRDSGTIDSWDGWSFNIGARYQF